MPTWPRPRASKRAKQQPCIARTLLKSLHKKPVNEPRIVGLDLVISQRQQSSINPEVKVFDTSACGDETCLQKETRDSCSM
ncbi:hypothetical protein IWW45_006274 [Coemansia sp. RSA 485]|nr:hypothetical protein IWW45_006274 [Coemansia sp. RSA 485]